MTRQIACVTAYLLGVTVGSVTVAVVGELNLSLSAGVGIRMIVGFAGGIVAIIIASKMDDR